MGVNPNQKLPFSPAVRLFIPLLYAAWSDKLLTPSEIAALKKAAFQLDFLSEEDKEILQSWADPLRPPARDLYKLWEIHSRQASGQIPEDAPKTLMALGEQLARKDDPGESAPWADKRTQRTLARLEKALGKINQATYEMLFGESVQAEKGPTERAKKLKEILDSPYSSIKDQMRRLLSDPVFSIETIPLKEDYRTRVLGWLQLLASQGLGALSYPEAYGGKNEMGTYGAVFEMIALQDLSLTIKFGVQFGLWGGAVYNLGTKKHHDKYLSDTGAMQLPGCFAMTETGHGSNVRGLETTAIYRPDRGTFIVNSPHRQAGKEYIGNALHGKMAAVFAQLIVEGENHGVHALIVRLRDDEGQLLPGIRIEDNGYKLGLNGVDNGRIWFDHVEIPKENLLDRFGGVDEKGQYFSTIKNPSKRFFMMLGTLVGGRVCVPRAGLSAAKKGLTIAIRYALKRRQFAPNPSAPETLIMDYPSHQRRLLPLLAKAYALQFALDELLQDFVQHEGEDFRQIETRAAALKSYATWYTTHTLQECREACGGKGYLAENQLATLKADTDIFTTFEGDNTVLMQLVARGVLSEFKQQFHEEGNVAVLRILSKRITVAVTEQNPVIIRNTNAVHLDSAEFQQNAFRYRESRLLTTVANRLRGHIKAGKSAYEAGLICQTHLLALADAYAEKMVLDAILKKEAQIKNTLAKASLAQIRALFALSCIEKHKGWYLEQDYIAPVKSKAIRDRVEEHCLALRPNVKDLIEAFAIPEVLLAAPIASKEK
ncbi:MAG TPA: acyl-CoA dehydrogenase [Saprospiraceae bacterium]|nr:acyl-CoA dehydrogenase [Saprospiraceae bacterium]